MDENTYTPELSANISSLEESMRSTIQAVLSSLQEVQNKVGLPPDVPHHPYERLKHEHVTSKGKDFYSHEDIEVDPSVEPHHFNDLIKEISDCKHQRTLDHMDYIANYGHQSHEHAGNMFASVSDNDITLDTEHIASHIQYVEMLKNIPLSAIDADPKGMATKILSKYVETYHPSRWS